MKKATLKVRQHHLRRTRKHAKRRFRHQKVRRIIRRSPAAGLTQAAEAARREALRRERAEAAENRRWDANDRRNHVHDTHREGGKDNPIPVRGEPSGKRGLVGMLAGMGVWGNLFGRGHRG